MREYLFAQLVGTCVGLVVGVLVLLSINLIIFAAQEHLDHKKRRAKK